MLRRSKSRTLIAEKRKDIFIEHLANPDSPTFMNQTESYLRAYPKSNGGAQSASSRLMSQPKAQEKFLKCMEKYGLTDNSLCEVHSEILFKGEESNRLKAIRLAHELKGRLKHNYAAQFNNNVLPDPEIAQALTNLTNAIIERKNSAD